MVARDNFAVWLGVFALAAFVIWNIVFFLLTVFLWNAPFQFDIAKNFTAPVMIGIFLGVFWKPDSQKGEAASQPPVK